MSLGRTPGPDTGAGNLYHPSSEPSAHNSVMVTPELPPRRNTRLILPPPRERRSGSRLGGTYPQGASLDCDEGFMQPGKQSQENMNVEDVYPPELSRLVQATRETEKRLLPVYKCMRISCRDREDISFVYYCFPRLRSSALSGSKLYTDVSV